MGGLPLRLSPTDRRAIGIIRVSQKGTREGDRFVSPEDQRTRIEKFCLENQLQLVQTLDETASVSGGRALEDRPGFGAAVEQVERGSADVIVAGYFDRFFRSLTTQAEAMSRVQRAGGQLVAVDYGELSEDTAGQWLNATVWGMMAEYQRRSAKERAAEGQRRAVARGAIPFKNVPIGYRRRPDGTLAVYEPEVPIVREAFEMRAAGTPIEAIRLFLRANGIERVSRGVTQTLANRLYVGELHFGEMVNLAACEPIIDRDLFDRVQAMKVPRGRIGKRDDLLARQGVLRCGQCDARMTVDGGSSPTSLRVYRCKGRDCQQPAVISAYAVEHAVVDHVKNMLRGIREHAGNDAAFAAATAALDRAQASLDAAIEAFDGLGAEPAAGRRLQALKAERDAAQMEYEKAVARKGAATVTVDIDDWDRLTLDEQRALIKAVLERVAVAPGVRGRGEQQGAGRLTFEPRI